MDLDESVLTSPPSREDEDPIQFKSTMILLASIVVAYMYLIYSGEKKKVVKPRITQQVEEEKEKRKGGKDLFSILTKCLFGLSFVFAAMVIGSLTNGEYYKNTRWLSLKLQLYCTYGAMISMMFDIYRYKPSMFLIMAQGFGISILISRGFYFFYEQVNYEPKTIKPTSSSLIDDEVDDDWSQEVLNKEDRRLKDRKDQNNLEWLKWLADNFSDM